MPKTKEEALHFAKIYLEVMMTIKKPPLDKWSFVFNYPDDKDDAELIWHYINKLNQ